MMMNKTLIALLTASALSAPALAVDTEWFVGGGAAWQQDAIEGSVDKDVDDIAYQFRGGIIIDDTHRMTLSYNYKEDDFDRNSARYSLYQNMYLASYDYIYQVGQSDFNLFVGPSVGVADNKFAGNSHTDFVYGGQVGGQYELSDSWSLEVGYRYLDQDYEERGRTVAGNFELADSQQVYTALDYKF